MFFNILHTSAYIQLFFVSNNLGKVGEPHPVYIWTGSV